jgi:hypothetical protein
LKQSPEIALSLINGFTTLRRQFMGRSMPFISPTHQKTSMHEIIWAITGISAKTWPTKTLTQISLNNYKKNIFLCEHLRLTLFTDIFQINPLR